MDDHPRLRPVEAFPFQQEGKTLVCLRDPQNFANTLVISPAVYFTLSHFDGKHSLIDVQEAYCRQLGDREPITSDFLRWVEEEDQRLIARLASLDAPGFFQEIARDQDRRRICGFSPLYSLIHLLDGTQGRNLKYGQAFTRETGSAVTFTSMVFD